MHKNNGGVGAVIEWQCLLVSAFVNKDSDINQQIPVSGSVC